MRLPSSFQNSKRVLAEIITNQALGIQVCKCYQLWGLEYTNVTYFGLFGSPTKGSWKVGASCVRLRASVCIFEWPTPTGWCFSTFAGSRELEVHLIKWHVRDWDGSNALSQAKAARMCQHMMCKSHLPLCAWRRVLGSGFTILTACQTQSSNGCQVATLLSEVWKLPRPILSHFSCIWPHSTNTTVV